jgi:hypothetical protein
MNILSHLGTRERLFVIGGGAVLICAHLSV